MNQADQKQNVALIVKMDHGDYWNTVKIGAEAAAKEFNINLTFSAPRDEEDVKGQIALINQSLQLGADALVLAANDSNILAGIAGLGSKRKLPVVAIDSQLESTRVKSFIGTNNYDSGTKAGQKLVELMGETSHVAIMSYVQSADNAAQREKGLMDALKAYPGINVVAKEYCFSDSQLASTLTHKMMTEHKQIDVIVALNTIASIGVANEIQKMGLGGHVKIITFDSTTEELALLQEGIIQATIIQNPFSMGYLGVKYAVEAMNGHSIPDHMDTGSKVIDMDNMFWSENQKLLFPFVK
jgi:ribose transport system substrate-binding protein